MATDLMTILSIHQGASSNPLGPNTESDSLDDIWQPPEAHVGQTNNKI